MNIIEHGHQPQNRSHETNAHIVIPEYVCFSGVFNMFINVALVR